MTEMINLPPIPPDLPVEKLVQQCINNAMDVRASDLFFEMHENRVTVLIRHLGVLHLQLVLPKENGRHCIAYIKAMAGMNVAEHRRPQDGRWVHKHNEHMVDLRISTIPTLYGEDLSMRLLVRDFALMSLDELGLIRSGLNDLLTMLNSPGGLILVTGPTGSGKTTTLYACLRYLNNGKRKINTIEDPVEYAIDGVRQSYVNHQLKVDFPDLLPAVLRQAPDVIMIGEIRDAVTATTAVRAANSGHLVMATLHAPMSAGAIQSMLGLGVHPHFLASSLRGVIAQRLVRTLCDRCKEPFDVSMAPHTFDQVRRWLEPGEGQTLYVAKGCDACYNVGYTSRTGIFETLSITHTLRDLIINRKPTDALRDQSLKEGLIEMRHAAMIKVARGETTVEEILRVIPVEFMGLST